MRRAATESPIASRWKALDEALVRWREEHGESAKLSASLVAFMRWCSAQSIAPDDVSDRVISTYYSSKTSKSYKRKDCVRHYENALRRAWNAIVSRVPEWPQAFVTQPPRRHELPTQYNGHVVALPERQFHPALVADVRHFCASGGFLLDQSKLDLRKISHSERMQRRLHTLATVGAQQRPIRPLHPLSADTLYLATRAIYMTATASYLAGRTKLNEMQSIAEVMTADGMALLADACEKRLGRTKGRMAAMKLYRYFRLIAARCGLHFTPEQREALRDLKDDLGGIDYYPASGISERNLKKLMAYDDQRRFAMLVALPEVVIADLERARRRTGRVTLRQAQLATRALAVELLNTLPIRRKTIVSLVPERNLLRPRGGAPKLVIYPDQEKTGRILEARLSERTWRLINLYRRRYRPVLAGAEDSLFLFPGAKGGQMTRQAFAAGITRFVTDRVGAHTNPHLWRHLMSSKVAESTGRIEDAESLLGHSMNSQATQRYARLRSKAAAERLREITDSARAEGITLLRAKATPRHRRR